MILTDRYSNMPGQRKVLNQEYILEDALTKRRVTAGSQWEACFRPGRRIIMTIVFVENKKLLKNKCLACGLSSSGPPGSTVDW
jgi:hypothetical protein